MTIETKLNDGDKVFFIHQAKVIESVVRGFKIERLKGRNDVIYLCNKDSNDNIHLKVNEEIAFPTKDALLKSL